MNEKNTIWGFWSYARFDNKHDHDTLVRLWERIKGEVRAHSGLEFEVFMDQDGLKVGQHWEGELRTALQRAKVLIPIVSPSYFKSKSCYKEYKVFKEREEDLGFTDLIAPIYYLTSDVFEGKIEIESLLDGSVPPETSEWAFDLHERQYADFRPIRNSARNSVQAHKMVEKFAKGLIVSLKALHASRLGSGTIEALPTYSLDEVEPEPEVNVSPDAAADTFEREKSGAQRRLVSHLYKLHREYISLDNLFKEFAEKFGPKIGSTKEMYWRLKTLHLQGLVVLQAVGDNSTIIRTRPEVGTLLSKRKLINKS
jgi:TIR domain-containing protein